MPPLGTPASCSNSSDKVLESRTLNKFTVTNIILNKYWCPLTTQCLTFRSMPYFFENKEDCNYMLFMCKCITKWNVSFQTDKMVDSSS